MSSAKNRPKTPSLAELQRATKVLTEALQRERADAENIRRQHAEQLQKIQSLVKAQIVTDLLPIIDNFERSLKHVPANLEGNEFVKGVSGVVKQFAKTLTDIGVNRIPTVGYKFDPHFHEAVGLDNDPETEVHHTKLGMEEIVSEELQAGYTIGDEVIRHAKVHVKLVSNKE